MNNESSVNQINNNSQNHYYIIKDYFLWFYIYIFYGFTFMKNSN